MKKNLILIILFTAAILGIGLVLRAGTREARSEAVAEAAEYPAAEVNGVTIHYEVFGEDGPPVILLHGNGGTHRDLGFITEALVNAGYKVYAPDSRGQGANEPEKEYHYADMADDVYELISFWELDRPALYGWSDGGIIGLLTEIRHPGTLSALAASGANVSPDGLKGYFINPVRLMSSIGGDPMSAMIANEPDISEEELSGIDISVLITAGEDDIIKEEHTRMIADSIPGAELMIFEGENHGSYITGSTKMADALVEFLTRF